MKPIPNLFSPPVNVLPDGLTPVAASGVMGGMSGALTTLGPFISDETVLDTRVWSVPMTLYAEYRVPTVTSISCGFFSENYPEEQGGDAPGTGQWYESATLTYRSALDYTPPDPPAFAFTSLAQSLTWAVDGEGLQSCTLASVPEELPDPPEDGGPWVFYSISFDDPLESDHRFQWARAVLAITGNLAAWQQISYIDLVEDGISVRSDDLTAGRFDVRFRLATRDGGIAKIDQSGVVAFDWRIEEGFDEPLVENTFSFEAGDSLTVIIPEGDTFSEPSDEVSRPASIGEEITITGPDIGANGRANNAPVATRSIVSGKLGMLPFLQRSGDSTTRYRAATSSGSSPGIVTGSYAGDLTIEKDEETGIVFEIADPPLSLGFLPPVIEGIEIVSTGTDRPGLRFPSDVAGYGFSKAERSETVYFRSGFRRYRDAGTLVEGIQWHRIRLTDESDDDPQQVATDYLDDPENEESLAADQLRALEGAIAAFISPDHRLTHLQAVSTIYSADDDFNLASLWYRLFDTAGIPAARRLVLPNGPPLATVDAISVTGQSVNQDGSLGGAWAVVLQPTEDESAPLEAEVTASPGSSKKITEAVISWTGDTRLAYPLCTATDAEVI